MGTKQKHSAEAIAWIRRMPAACGIASFFVTTALTTSLSLLVSSASAQPLPAGGNVIAGRATISQPDATQLIITQQTDRAVINWNSFSIGASNRVDIVQPGSSSISVQQVIGQNPSNIFGALTSNGQVLIANPNGIWFGSDAHVDVAGVTATTATLSPANVDVFMSGGSLGFDIAGKSDGSVVNDGMITVADGGLATFVAPGVANTGVISARVGRVNLAAGNRFTIDLYGDGLVSLAVGDKVLASALGPDGKPLSAAVVNSGQVLADGGKIYITANVAKGIVDDVIDMTGVLQARSVANIAGEIVLSGGDGGIVAIGGTLDASGTAAAQTGGTTIVRGDAIALNADARINVSGDAGGGTALIGGDFHGAGPEKNAQSVFIGSGATIKADAMTSGDGGNVAIWGDNSAIFHGVITARGGTTSGRGGFVETSSRVHLDIGGGRVDTRAADGSAGMWLLDPTNVTISASATVNESFGSDTYTPTGAGANILNTDIAAALVTSNVTIDTASGLSEAGDIFINADVLVGDNLGNARVLTLNAAGGISGSGNLGKAADRLDIRFNQGGNGAYSGAIAGTGGVFKEGAGTLTLSGANTYTGLTTISAGTLAYGVNNALSTGAVTVNGATAVLDLGTFTDSVGAVTLAGGGSITGTGTLTSTGSFAMQSGSVSAILAGAVALNKTTAGTVTLSKANTYTGLTTISAGTLAYGVNNALSTGAVTVNGATAVLDLGTFTDSVGAVTLAA